MEKKVITNNNTAVYYYKNNHLHRFCITLYIKAGILYENRSEIGITHFWEHMVFRNINAVLDGEMKKKLDRIGAYFNGSTCKEYVELKIIAATKHFKECVDIITKTFEEHQYSDEDLELERKRVKAEIRENNEKTSIYSMTQKQVWKSTKLSKSISGKGKTLDTIGRKQLEKYGESILSPNNMFFYVTGSFTENNIKYLCKCIDKYTFTQSLAKDNLAELPHNFMNRNARVKVKKGDMSEVSFSFDFDATKYTRAELELLYDILFYGECSKIFVNLSENAGLIYSFDPELEQYSNIGNISFSYEVRAKKMLDSIEKVIETLKELKEGINDELDYVKPSYIENADMDLDEPEKLNQIMAFDKYILGCGYDTMEERIKEYDGVTPQRMTEVVNEIFTTSNMVVVAKTDKKSICKEDILKIVEKL